MKNRALSLIIVVFVILQINYSVKSEALEKPCLQINTQKNFIKIYDFNNITSSSSTHVASYMLKIKDLNNRPPKNGPDIEGLIEFSSNDYSLIYKSDNLRAKASSYVGKQLHHFKFKIEEEVSEIKSLNVLWEGHASNTFVNFYIWNFKENIWELVGINRLIFRDNTISRNYIGKISNYINESTKELYVVAITHAATILKQKLFTNYVQVKVGNPTTVTLKDDAYHYNNELIYVEWWFFHVINETQDLQFFISYYVLNPKFGFAAVVLGVFNKEDTYEILEIYKLSQFNASYEKPDVKIGNSSLEAQDENTFFVKGELKNRKNSAEWNLTFDRTAPPYDFKESPGESQYLCYLPGAWVNGTIELDGTIYRINESYGYHDHNWGAGPFLPCKWAWAVTCKPEDGFALAMEKVEHLRWNTRQIYVTYGDITTTFEDIQTKFKKYTADFSSFYPFFTYYPKVRHIYAKNNEGYEIEFNAIVQKNLPIYMGIPRVLNEQVSLFQGTLSKDGLAIYSFDVQGFTDYSVG